MIKHKNYILISIATIVIGIILLIVGLTMGGSSSLRLTSSGFEFGPFKNFEIVTDTVPSDVNKIVVDVDYINSISIRTGEEFSVRYDKFSTDVAIADGTLKVLNPVSDYIDSGNFAFMSVDFASLINYDIDNNDNSIIIEVPQEINIDDIQVYCQTGDLEISNQTVSELYILSAYGDIELSELEAEIITIEASSSETTLSDVDVDRLDVIKDYGDFNASSLAVSDIDIKHSSGDILLDDIVVDSSIVVEGDYCDIAISTPMAEDDFSIEAFQEYGDMIVNNQRLGSSLILGGGEKHIGIDITTGDIDLTFNG